MAAYILTHVQASGPRGTNACASEATHNYAARSQGLKGEIYQSFLAALRMTNRLGPLQPARHDTGSRLVELLVPQPHLASLGVPLRRQHLCCQVLGASRMVEPVVYGRHQGLLARLRTRQ